LYIPAWYWHQSVTVSKVDSLSIDSHFQSNSKLFDIVHKGFEEGLIFADQDDETEQLKIKM
jgi:hypothetical protein